MCLVTGVPKVFSRLFLLIVVVSPAMDDSREAARWRATGSAVLPGASGHGGRGGFLSVTMTGVSAGA